MFLPYLLLHQQHNPSHTSTELQKKVTLLPTAASSSPPAAHCLPLMITSSWAQASLLLLLGSRVFASTVPSPRMATAMPAATPSLPGYEVSGGAVAAAPRHCTGSVGAFLAVLATVLVLTVVSCVVGRACAARAEGPDERYDCAGLAGRRCWRWRRASRRPVRPAEEVKQPAPLPSPEP